MRLTIISSQMTGIYTRLCSLGFYQMDGVFFTRTPFKVNGMWRCEVRV